MGICTRCGYLSNDEVQEEHVCAPEKVDFMKGMAKMCYDLAVYVDPASTTTQKNNALTRIQAKRAWMEANAAILIEWLG
jgi:hypothetical protein